MSKYREEEIKHTKDLYWFDSLESTSSFP